ncbi:MAG: YggT family protein [Burkholderiaceae bacterium]
MLYQITSLLLEIAASLLASVCLLRLYMQHQKLPFGNPVGQFVFALSNWLVLPLRRVLPALGRWDTASGVAAYAVVWLKLLLLSLLVSGLDIPLLGLTLGAFFGLLRVAISALTGLLIVYAIASWLQSGAPLLALLGRLCEPLLRPVRRLVPLVGGIDLSPLLLLVALQVVSIVLTQLQALAMGPL